MIEEHVRLPFAIVGIGASAGGLEALTTILASLPEDLPVAVVVVVHLAPQQESSMPMLLATKARLAVTEAVDGAEIAPAHVYVIPPNTELSIQDGRLRLAPRSLGRASPIDVFLRALADHARARAVGIVLSGTGSDGAIGLQEIKAAGGITIAQAPETAKFDSMPRAAIATRMVDLVLPPHEIASALTYMGRHPQLALEGPPAYAADATRVQSDQLQQIFTLLRTVSSVDFRQYKLPTIERRLHRRMLLNKFARIDDYIRHLEKNRDEVNTLYKDILINVTRFFREPESFHALAEQVFPVLIREQREEQPIRVWISGCATGEEAYSLAIALLEFLGERATGYAIQIFATDLSDAGIDAARTGVYPETIAADVSPERLRRFFTKTDAGYRINKLVRDACVFARQDLTRDPPFSKMDLILCRNVLIYMSSELQKRLIVLFHYALKPHGFLMLGQAETIGVHSDLFTLENKKHRIYRRKQHDIAPGMRFEIDQAAPAHPSVKKLVVHNREISKTLHGEATQIILDRYAPPGVIVDGELQVVHFRGQTGLFLEPPTGEPSNNVLKMAREGLLYGLRTALHAARKGGASVRKEGLRVKANGGWIEVRLDVVPLSAAHKGHYLVLFTRQAEQHGAGAGPRSGPGGRARSRERQDAHLKQLQEELATSREYLQSIIQELEAANEELQAANEEILSSNEELQSTNEELDTAKEELQSTNEELNTVNDELHGRNEELSSVNSDLINLLGSVQLAIVIIARDLRIRRFTPMAEKVLNLIASDVGRPISHIKPNIECHDLERMIVEAIDTVSGQEREVRDRQGNLFSLRIRPYQNAENRIDGAVLTLFDIGAAKRHETQLQEMRDFAQAIVETVREPLAVLDAELKVKIASAAFSTLAARAPAEMDGLSIYELLGVARSSAEDGGAAPPALQSLLETMVPTAVKVADHELACTLPGAGPRTLRVNARLVGDRDALSRLILLAFDEATQGDGA